MRVRHENMYCQTASKPLCLTQDETTFIESMIHSMEANNE